MPPEDNNPMTSPQSAPPTNDVRPLNTVPVAPINNPAFDSINETPQTPAPLQVPPPVVPTFTPPFQGQTLTSVAPTENIAPQMPSNNILPPPTSPFMTKPVFQGSIPPAQPVAQNAAPSSTGPLQVQPKNFDDFDPNYVAEENIYTEICTQIIKDQEKIIGTLAIEQANKVTGLIVDPITYHCTVSGDGSLVIDKLIEQYRNFFGHAAVEVCKEAASRFIGKLPAEKLPISLR
jgi:hypothetical protein